MRLAPGSLLWLLRHELRLQWRHRMRSWRRSATLIVVAGLVLAQLIGLAVARWLAGAPLADRLALSNLVLACVGLLMLSNALSVAVEALYERRDLEWLMSSPVSLRRLLAVRMLGVAVSVAAPYLLFLGPVANALAVFGEPGALAAYPVLGALAVAATALGAGAVVALTPLAGLRRTRAMASALALLVGALAFLGSQSNTLLPQAAKAALWRALTPDCCGVPEGVAWWPARATLGDALPLAAVLTVAAVAAAGVSRVLDRRFAAGLAAGPSADPRPRAAADPGVPRFRGGLRRVLLAKELRLLRRRTGLFGQAALQLVYLAPATVGLWRGSLRSGGFAVTALLVLAAGEMARMLMSAVITGDDAAELAGTAPVPPRGIVAARMQAAGIAAALILLLPVAVAAVAFPWTAPVLLAGVGCAAASGMLLGLWSPTPLRRSDLGAQQGGSTVAQLIALGVSIAWAGAAWLALAADAWAIAPAAVAGAMLLAARR